MFIFEARRAASKIDELQDDNGAGVSRDLVDLSWKDIVSYAILCCKHISIKYFPRYKRGCAYTLVHMSEILTAFVCYCFTRRVSVPELFYKPPERHKLLLNLFYYK